MKRLSIITLIFAFVLTTAMPPTGSAQNGGFEAAQPVRRNQEFTVTFHRPNLKNNEVVWINGTDKVDAGAALTDAQIEQGFHVGDYIVIRMKAPMDCFVYGVNNSQWDGVSLVENGEKLQAGVERDFVYKLTNDRGNQGVGTEGFLYLIRTQKIPEEEISKYLKPTTPVQTQPVTGAQQPSPPSAPVLSNSLVLGGTPAQQQAAIQSIQQNSPKKKWWQIFIPLTCTAMSVFLPFAGAGCNVVSKVAGFSAAKPVRRGQVAPTDDTQNMVIQISFPLSAG